MKEIHFRTAEPNDLPILLSFEQGIITAERPFDPTLDKDPLHYYDLGKYIEAEDVEIILATHKNEIVGSCYVKKAKAKAYVDHEFYAYLGFVFVQPDFRGQGISGNLVNKAKEWALANDLNELRLEVYEENTAAIRSYQKAGLKKHMVEMRIGL